MPLFWMFWGLFAPSFPRFPLYKWPFFGPFEGRGHRFQILLTPMASRLTSLPAVMKTDFFNIIRRNRSKFPVSRMVAILYRRPQFTIVVYDARLLVVNYANTAK
jgi:hypothetical protein